MISDLIDSDGMGWTDADGDDETVDPIVTSITFGSQTGSQLVGFEYDHGHKDIGCYRFTAPPQHS